MAEPYGSMAQAFIRTMCLFLMSFGMLCVGVGIKFAVKKHYAHYKRIHAYMLVGGLSFTLFWLYIKRFDSSFLVMDQDSEIYGVNVDLRHSRQRRYVLWGLQTFMSLAILPLPLLVELETGVEGATTQGLSAPQLLAILIFVLALIMAVELLIRPSLAERELMYRKISGVKFEECMLSRTGATRPCGAEPRNGRELWTIVRQKMKVWAYTQRFKRTIASLSDGTLQRPGTITEVAEAMPMNLHRLTNHSCDEVNFHISEIDV